MNKWNATFLSVSEAFPPPQDEVVSPLLSPQYLPVYTPSEEEKENPALFANNVRQVMAK